MSPVKLFINSALNIQSGPDYRRGGGLRGARGAGGIFEFRFMNSATVSCVFRARIVNWVEL